MNRMKLLLQKVTLASAITLAFVSFISYPVPVNSSLIHSPAQIAQANGGRRFVLRSRGRRGRRIGGAGRSPSDKYCPPLKEKTPLTALVPRATDSPDSLRKDEEPIMGATFESHPTFWFYIPYNSPIQNKERLEAKFTIQDEKREQYIIKTFPIDLSETPGIVSVRPPDTEKPLEESKTYYWNFQIICDPNDPSKNPYVDGWIQRDTLTPEDRKKLEQATVQQKLDFYFKRSIWHEALTLLAESRRDRPNDTTLNADWNSLLQDETLRKIADKPVVRYCYPRAEAANHSHNIVSRN